jgi:hypothetical protein
VTAPTAISIDSIVGEVNSALDEVDQLVKDIIAGVNSVLDQLSESVVAEIRAAVADLQRMASDVIAEVRRQIAMVGAPNTLRAAGDGWREVGGLVSAQAGKATLNSTRADDKWTGTAAEAYRNTLLVQEKALVAFRARTDDIDNVLQGMATAINVYWATIAGAVTALSAGLISALISASTVVGAPAAPVFAAAAIIAFGSAIAAAMVAITNVVNECAVSAAGLDASLNNSEGFPGGIWPSAATPDPHDDPTNTDFSDASLNDGDDTDWHMK